MNSYAYGRFVDETEREMSFNRLIKRQIHMVLTGCLYASM